MIPARHQTAPAHRVNMTITELETVLLKDWAVDRRDIQWRSILWMGRTSLEVRAARPMGPKEALKVLGITPDQLIELLKREVIGRPGKGKRGSVAWRFDEIDRGRGRVRGMIEDREI
jgi:hypothetical protein